MCSYMVTSTTSAALLWPIRFTLPFVVYGVKYFMLLLSIGCVALKSITSMQMVCPALDFSMRLEEM